MSYHLAIGGAVGGGPIVLTVLDGQTYRIRDQIITDWTEWRACEAGIRLQEHGYMILPSSQTDHRRMAGWAVLAGIGFAVEVQETEQTPAETLATHIQDATTSVEALYLTEWSERTSAGPAVQLREDEDQADEVYASIGGGDMLVRFRYAPPPEPSQDHLVGAAAVAMLPHTMGEDTSSGTGR